IYLAVSLPPDFRYPTEFPPHAGAERSAAPDYAAPDRPAPDHIVPHPALAGQTMLEDVVLPVCAERNLPFAMMIGSIMRVNPDLRDGGDMVGKADVQSVVRLCRQFPQNRFFVTMLARENQHELCV